MTQRLEISLDPNLVVRPVVQSIQQCTEIASFVLESIESANLENAPHPRTNKVALNINSTLSADDRKRNYQNWIMQKGFQELARAVRYSLERAAGFLAIVESLHLKTADELTAAISMAEEKARESNFPTLIVDVSKRLSAPLEFQEEFKALQKIRNCLEHRAGIIAHTDLMTLSLPNIKIFYVRNGEEVELEVGSIVDGDAIDGQVQILQKRVQQKIEFKRGERITFTADQFYQIGMGCFLFAGDLAQKLEQTAKTAIEKKEKSSSANT